jgi:hypothetical protein
MSQSHCGDISWTRDTSPHAITAAQDEAIGQGLTAEGLVTAQVGVKILRAHRRCHEMIKSIDYLQYACTKYAAMLVALV